MSGKEHSWASYIWQEGSGPTQPATGRGERGGSGYAHVAVFYGSRDDVVQNLNMGKVFTITGLYGGYPGSSSYALLARGVEFDEIVANKLPYPPWWRRGRYLCVVYRMSS